MAKAFIFDMDGVVVDSEHNWEPYDRAIMERFFDTRIREAIGTNIGLGISGLYEKAKALGSTITYEEIRQAYDEAALKVYETAPITEGITRLAQKLIEWDFALALVTSSPHTWIDQVVPRLSFKDKFSLIVSIADQRDLKPKPAPDSYLFAMKSLGVTPAESIVLEDSNYGIAAGKASGAFTIGFTGNLVKGYRQEVTADATADTMDAVIAIVEKRL